MLADAVHMAFKQLVIALQSELELVLPALLSERLVAIFFVSCLSLPKMENLILGDEREGKYWLCPCLYP